MYTTRLTSAFALALVLAACGEAPTTAPAGSTATLSPAPANAGRKERPVPSTQVTNSPLTDAAGNVVGWFTGTITLRHVAVEGRSLVGTLVMNGNAVVNGVPTIVDNVPGTAILYTSGATATSASPAAAAVAPLAIGSCPILNLAIGQIHLNLLGLVVDLSAINLDIVAQSGARQPARQTGGNHSCTFPIRLRQPSLTVSVTR
jgi:hypothetical protein